MGAVGLTSEVKDSPRRLPQVRLTMDPYTPLQKYLAYFFKHLSRRSKNRGYSCTVTVKDLMELYKNQNGKCAITGMDMTIDRSPGQWHTYNVSVDRINNDKGYDLNNVQLVCQHINVMRGTLSVEEFLSLCKEIVKRISK